MSPPSTANLDTLNVSELNSTIIMTGLALQQYYLPRAFGYTNQVISVSANQNQLVFTSVLGYAGTANQIVFSPTINNV